MASDIQYPYAYDENNNRVFIEDIDKSTRRVHQYHCPDCEGKMKPRLVEHNAWHFAHDHHKCGLESYIHKMAKQILCDRFNNPLIPFRIRMTIARPCKQADYCKLEKEHSCINWKSNKEYELTQYYRATAQEEASFNDSPMGKAFRPDVLLCGNGGSRKDIFLEVFYKHKTEAEKIELGERIIEFRLKSLGDLRWLETAELFEEGDRVTFLNFPAMPIAPDQIEKEIKAHNRARYQSSTDQGELPTCRQSMEYRRQKSRWQRMTYLKNGEMLHEGVFENEFEQHCPNAVAEITYDSSKLMDPQHLYLLAASRIPGFRNCNYCDHYVNAETVRFCNIGKNGTSRKGTFDAQKGISCRFFEWNSWNKFNLKQIHSNYIEGVDYQIWSNDKEHKI